MNIPSRSTFLIIGGGIIGSAIAHFLALAGRAESVTVLEPDATYHRSSTGRSASAIRQQYNLGLNVEMSRFGYSFYRNADQHLKVHGESVDIGFVERPYLVLAAPAGVARLREAHARQIQAGADIAFLEPEVLAERVPWLKVDGIGAACLGQGGEGWFEPLTALSALRRKTESLGVTYLPARVVGIDVHDARVTGVHLEGGTQLEPDIVVNAAGPWAAEVSRLAGVHVPVESRKRTVFVFRAPHPPADFACLIDPTFASRGVFARSFGTSNEGLFMAVTSPDPRDDPHTHDFTVDEALFGEVIQPALARRVRGFEHLERVKAWAGHYEMNTFDQNAVIGFHPELKNFLLACGLSGHGVMHAPAIGRGIAELLTEGRYTSLDLSPFDYDRVRRGVPLDDVQSSEHRRIEAGV
ncbi:NAD(P)/FAD-dependent oxidoreductase [Deinococcus peraridilitoris]|uniref:Glycine/D-amino acid oxidase, deaminating n=1 Tax=Deinococcus peraridilitoris (strain DSM 19664 / LMG 22246 / CIP 109416 / KR-200) TaxID=937777 RepID=L0A2I8_DEIPD|nr:FAD-binding oxidoreductase [Deinococcus peraridilitoris]AFZ67225.1 glycine/D-amino acid oxidase, deaminating [Deinococcus peraridilitoris DSM 19664]